VLLGIGAVLQFSLIMSLPVDRMSTSEMESMASLVALLVSTAWSAITLRRRPRRSVSILAVGAVYSIYLIAHLAVAISHQLSSSSGTLSRIQMISVVVATSSLAILPLALAIAWPLRAGTPNASAANCSRSPGARDWNSSSPA
jgi:hypothetical protein